MLSFLFQLTFKLSYGLLSEASHFHLAVAILLLMRNGVVANTFNRNHRPCINRIGTFEEGASVLPLDSGEIQVGQGLQYKLLHTERMPFDQASLLFRI